jgi:hypothetical protein
MSLEAFFKPKSVAVIGASREPRKFGHVTKIANLPTSFSSHSPIKSKCTQSGTHFLNLHISYG